MRGRAAGLALLLATGVAACLPGLPEAAVGPAKVVDDLSLLAVGTTLNLSGTINDPTPDLE